MNPWMSFLNALPPAARELGDVISLFFYSGPGLIAAPFIVIGFLFMVIEIFAHGGRINSSGIHALQDIQFYMRNGRRK
jgi:hypothetical protein